MSDSDPENEQRGFVLAWRFRDLPAALLAKTALESANIECILSDENTIRMDWLWSNLLGGVKLWLKEEDADSLQELLDLAIPEGFEVPSVGEYKQRACPSCNSLDVSSEGSAYRIAYVFLFFGLPVPLKQRRCSCRSCGRRW